MNIIKLGLNGMPLPDKIQFGRQVTQNMTGNPNFPDPDPSLAAVTGQVDNSENSYNDARTARQIAKSKTSLQDDQEAALDLILTKLATYVEQASNGDKAKIESAGFSVRNLPVPTGLLPAPTNLVVLPSEHAGSADLSWDSARGARSFLMERAEDAATLEYHILGATTKREASLNSMVSGKKYWFRVAAVNAAGQSAWSDPVPLFAP